MPYREEDVEFRDTYSCCSSLSVDVMINKLASSSLKGKSFYETSESSCSELSFES
jgi:hypothetical protein